MLEKIEVDAVVDTVDWGGTIGGNCPEVFRVVSGAGYDKLGVGNFPANFLFIRGIDIFGVGSKTKRNFRKQRGKHRDRGGRMGKMAMELRNALVFFQVISGQVARLQQVFESRKLFACAESLGGHPECSGKLFWLLGGQKYIGPEQSEKILEQFCGEIIHPCLNLFY